MIPAPTAPVGTFVDPASLPTDAQLKAVHNALGLLWDGWTVDEARGIEEALRGNAADRRSA